MHRAHPAGLPRAPRQARPAGDRGCQRCLCGGERRHSAPARGALTPGEAERIAIVVETFARAILTTKRRELAANQLQIFGLDDFYDGDGCDSDESDDGDYGDADEYDPE